MVEERDIRQESERELIHRIVAGSKQEFCFLVDRYKQKIYGLLRGMGASPMDAQDLTQETFIKAYRKLASHQPDKSFASWLYTIAANLLKDHKKKHRFEEHPIGQVETAVSDGPEQSVLQTERRTEFQRLLALLPANYRMALLLRYTNDLSYEEIGEVLEVSVSKVQNDLYRAKKRLKQIMTESKEGLEYEMLEPR